MKCINLMLGLFIISGLLLSSIPVNAIDDSQELIDGINDVQDFATGDVITEHPDVDVDDIDIESATYTQADKDVTVAIIVKGNIANRGSIVDILEGGVDPDLESYNIDSVGYVFEIITSNDYYSITYVNTEAQLVYDSGFAVVNLTDDDIDVDGDTLEISFELQNDSETLEEFLCQSTYIKMDFSIEDFDNLEDYDDLSDLLTYVVDNIPNPELEILEAYASNVGETDKDIEFTGSIVPGSGTPPFEYEWDFGDGETSDQKDTTHSYSESGTYDYMLTINDASGTEVSESGQITISGGSSGESSTTAFILIIVIIAIVGVIAIVYIIRR